MEKKTMGSFLAALRRASGMTQKELAEKLNVSDKSVSRWERDEGAPDLALLPVLAEIFGVTCDELLRGERTAPVSAAAEEMRTEKAEKQRRRLLASGLARFRSHSCVSLALALGGFCVAMGCNSGLDRALVGFFLGAVFFLAAAAVEVLQINAALLAVDGEEGEDAAAYRRYAVRGAELVLGAGWVLFAETLPLLLAFYPAKVNGFTISRTSVSITLAPRWMFVVLLLALLVWGLAVRGVNTRLAQKGIYEPVEQEAEKRRKNGRLQRVTALALCAALAVSAWINGALTGFGDAGRMAKGIEFTSFEDFSKFMRQAVSPDYFGPDVPSAGGEADYPIYYEEDGTPIYKSQSVGQVIEDTDGNVLCNFLWRNRSVISWTLGKAKDGYLPVIAHTQESIVQARQRAKWINRAFYAVYAAEVLAACGIYRKKRAK